MSGNLTQFRQRLGNTALNIPRPLMQEALEGLAAQSDFPTTRDESWKYTRLGRVAALQLSPQHLPQSPNPLVSERLEIIFEADQWACSSHTIPGLTIVPAASVASEDWQACTGKGHVQHLNTLTAQGGICISIEAGTHIDEPIRIIHRMKDVHQSMVLHHQITVGVNAYAQLELIFEGSTSASYSNILTDFFLAEGAKVNVDKWQNFEGEHYGFYSERIYQQKNSVFSLQTLTVNTHFSRNDVEVFSQGEAAHTQLYGAFFGRENNHIDNHTYVHHSAPHGTSDENYKGILSDKALGVFNGKIKVYQDAQKINAFQSNKNILLSESAAMNSKPELEIYADDVKCSHGSTTGQLDQQALFFLRTRGISKEKAADMLIKGFMADILGAVKSTHIQEAMHTLLV